jgi:hypothetical protein
MKPSPSKKSIEQLETLLTLAIKCRDLAMGEHCVSKYGTSYSATCHNHGSTCQAGRESLSHLASCKGSFSGSCSLDCATLKLFLQCFRSHPTEAAKLSCKKCCESNPEYVQTLSDTLEKLKRSEIEPTGQLQNIGASFQAPKAHSSGTLLVAALEAIPIGTGAVEVRRPQQRYGPTFSQLRVLSLLEAEPLFTNPAVSGQLHSRAADRVRAEISALEHAAKSRSEAARRATEVSLGEIVASASAAEIERFESEIKRLAGFFAEAQQRAITLASEAVALSKKSSSTKAPVQGSSVDEVLASFRSANEEAKAHEAEITSLKASLAARIERDKEKFKNYSRSWRDAGICSPTAAGLSHIVRAAAHTSGAILFQGDAIGEIDTFTCLPSSSSSSVKWLTDLGARVPTTLDGVPFSYASAIARGEEASIQSVDDISSASGTSDGRQFSLSAHPELLQPRYRLRSSHIAHPINSHGREPKGRAAQAIQEAAITAASSPVSYVYDVVTQMLLHILPGILAVTRARNIKEATAARKLNVAVNKESELTIARLVPGTIASIDAPLEKAPGAMLEGGGGPQPPLEVRESNDPSIHSLFQAIRGEWLRWYQTQRNLVIQKTKGGDLNRTNKTAYLANLAADQSRPDRAMPSSRDADFVKDGHIPPIALYTRLIREASHDACRKFYCRPLEKMADQLALRADADLQEFSPETFPREGKEEAYPAVPQHVSHQLKRTIALRSGAGDAPVVVADSSSGPDATLVQGAVSNARVTSRDVLTFLKSQLSGSAISLTQTSIDGSKKKSVAFEDMNEIEDEEDVLDEDDEVKRRARHEKLAEMRALGKEIIRFEAVPTAYQQHRINESEKDVKDVEMLADVDVTKQKQKTASTARSEIGVAVKNQPASRSSKRAKLDKAEVVEHLPQEKEEEEADEEEEEKEEDIQEPSNEGDGDVDANKNDEVERASSKRARNQKRAATTATSTVATTASTRGWRGNGRTQAAFLPPPPVIYTVDELNDRIRLLRSIAPTRIADHPRPANVIQRILIDFEVASDKGDDNIALRAVPVARSN